MKTPIEKLREAVKGRAFVTPPEAVDDLIRMCAAAVRAREEMVRKQRDMYAIHSQAWWEQQHAMKHLQSAADELESVIEDHMGADEKRDGAPCYICGKPKHTVKESAHEYRPQRDGAAKSLPQPDDIKHVLDGEPFSEQHGDYLRDGAAPSLDWVVERMNEQRKRMDAAAATLKLVETDLRALGHSGLANSVNEIVEQLKP